MTKTVRATSVLARGTIFGALFSALAWATPGLASQTEVFSVEGADLFGGDLDGASIGGDFRVRSGPEQKAILAEVPGAVLSIARAGDGQLYVSTSGPAKVLKVNGSEAVDFLVSDKALVTSILPVGKTTLVALTSPDGGAERISLKDKSHTLVPSPVKLLLAGVVVDDVIYAVGGGDDGGVLLKLAPGAKGFETLATTEEMLRSVAVRSVKGSLKIVVGGADNGVVYELVGKRLVALLDAEPGETTSLAIDKEGTVFGGFTDGDGKLSKAATSKAKVEDDDDEKKTKKKKKAPRVKGGEVWRIGVDGTTRMLFQSKTNGPYALALGVDEAHLLVGTGPDGRVYDLDVEGRVRPGVLSRRDGADEVAAILVERGGIIIGTSHAGSVIFLNNTAGSRSTWLSPVLEASSRARFGLLRARVERGAVGVALRTGNTKEPDDSWSGWSSTASLNVASGGTGTTLTTTPAQYAQVRLELPRDAEVAAVHLAYLVDNRPPEVQSIEVLAPGWKVIATPRDPPETRSVTMGEKAFAKFLDRRGAQNPTMEDRPYGKQSFDVGYRTVFAFVEDPDKDALRYRFWLGRVKGAAQPATWSLLADWSEQPFASFEASRLADGDYRVRVDVDDSPTNGAARQMADGMVSGAFVVSHQVPVASAIKATRAKGGVHIELSVQAALPLISVRCSTGMSEWLPVDPVDGILDGTRERFDAILPPASTDAVSCEIYDEALNFGRVDIPVR